MTLQPPEREIGVRALHDRLSEYLDSVENEVESSERRGEWLGVGVDGGAAALTLYFDTSALVKLIVVEDGSDLVAELWSAQPVACSILGYPEGRAALAAARRGRRLTSRAYARAVDDLDALTLELAIVGIDAPLSKLAGELAADMSLRGYDAVHLASALTLGASSTVLVTWDRDLGDAAAGQGLAVAPPR